MKIYQLLQAPLYLSKGTMKYLKALEKVFHVVPADKTPGLKSGICTFVH